MHQTRKALEECGEGDVIEVICDDPETLHDIPALCDRMGVLLQGVQEDSGEYIFVISNVTRDL